MDFQVSEKEMTLLSRITAARLLASARKDIMRSYDFCDEKSIDRQEALDRLDREIRRLVGYAGDENSP